MKEIVMMSTEDVRKKCIENNWYTRGDIESYDKLLTFISNIEYVTINTIKFVARDIKAHSNTDYSVESIMFIISNQCCSRFYE